MKPSIPKGTRDFTPVEMSRRNYIFDTIRNVFDLFGYRQIETPAMENLSTLMGKYGEEGDKLLFKIQNSGDYMSGLTDEELLSRDSLKLSSKFCEKGLRYDLTVPFARFVVMHREELQFPFKRFQIEPVWRADRPQKGRYREFYQCDADVVGSDSLLYEIELIQMIDTVFDRLGVRVAIKLNNRKILVGIAELIGHADKIVEITVAIDKLDKIGLAGVNAELLSKGLPQDAIDKIQPIINLTGSNSDKLDTIAGILAESKTGLKGVEECRYILNGIERLGVKNTLELDLTLARGLNYYTGAILEVKALDMEIGSICGGGRYDNLTGIFGLPGVSGVGISFGADRIYDVLNRLDLYPRETQGGVKVLFLNLGEKEAQFCMGLLAGLRRAGIASEIYPDAVKMRKQMSYANANAVRYVVIVGSDELDQGKVTLKNMETGEQSLVDADRLVKLIV
ncbi:MAG TPA: histidine--tRNA ligase [Bacteroidaceae bacterium]|jgi:histidyl-tRNA synthetase|nr:histidine--tRNA ligase [Bacteroidaceae bacterium]MBP8603234.1 histidine--tRNA ligase [Bacteroidaceae bacterium]HOD69108.1 histidine--tRNA ligase [Bacteroidaceae bacterium]HQL26612.1 histidine--tRNA ligase [Bacteroidaceae bacterium]